MQFNPNKPGQTTSKTQVSVSKTFNSRTDSDQAQTRSSVGSVFLMPTRKTGEVLFEEDLFETRLCLVRSCLFVRLSRSIKSAQFPFISVRFPASCDRLNMAAALTCANSSVRVRFTRITCFWLTRKFLFTCVGRLSNVHCSATSVKSP